ncbi:lymphocyte cytosolic protein 2 [Notolabrus celidotus]|uniref:lymphocyte cytosolic protein 2 n=1 Tax=Notolabrus celidotus TaxID=1203425 RepID=UPI00148F44C8|nr:lymphocyte cytosolic protein 2 [Notolabrus celidotus]
MSLTMKVIMKTRVDTRREAETATSGPILAQDNEEITSDEYEIPAVDQIKLPQHPRVATPQENNYRDSDHGPTPAERTSRPPRPHPKKQKTPLRDLQKHRQKQQDNPVCLLTGARSPGHPIHLRMTLKIKYVLRSLLHMCGLNKQSHHTPPVPVQPVKINSPLPEPRQCIQDMDPSWYGGQMTRHPAEAALREVNKDGAFLVRDSSKVSDEHPYTLMLLKQHKVFNIKIRNQGNSFSLGNGLNNKSFPGVREMITHHTHPTAAH